MTAENKIGSTEISFAFREVSEGVRTVSDNTSNVPHARLWYLSLNQGK
jgi:hypothetical protein